MAFLHGFSSAEMFEARLLLEMAINRTRGGTCDERTSGGTRRSISRDVCEFGQTGRISRSRYVFSPDNRRRFGKLNHYGSNEYGGELFCWTCVAALCKLRRRGLVYRKRPPDFAFEKRNLSIPN